MDHATVEGRKLKGEAGSLFVDDGGSGYPTIIFTHSFGGDSSHWIHQLSHLRSRHRAIAFDFRGHGSSAKPEQLKYTAEALANDIVAVADELDIDKFVLVGHSMGGSANIAYADSHPQRVLAMVLAGTPGKTPDEISRPVVASLQSEAYEKVMKDYMDRLVTDATPRVAEKVSKGVNLLSRETSTAIIKSLFEFDPIEKLLRFAGPKLIISTATELKQPNSLASQVPSLSTELIEGTSHWTQLDKPGEFNDILDRFLARMV
ncbi:MAG TPA: alpha/beta hydrolase [Chryseolinea sp.]